MSDSYPGAAKGELPGAPLARRLWAYGDQRRLFPHRRPLQLTPRTLVLGGWRVIRRQAVAGVRLTFTDGYRRSQAAGIGGNNASFGLFAGLGEPHASAGCTSRGVIPPLGVAILLAVAGLAAHLLPPIHLIRTRRQQRFTFTPSTR